MTAAIASLILRGLLAALISSLPTLAACAAIANANKPNILVMGEDADADSIPRYNSIYQRVQDAMASELHEAGYDVFDETAATLGEVAQGRIGRDDADLIEAARGARKPPIDVVVIFTVYASAHDTGYLTRLRARVSGRLLNVQSGQRLGSFEVASQKGWRISPDCARDRDCLLEAAGDRARLIGRDVAIALTAKLDHLYAGASDLAAPTDPATTSGDCLANGFTLTFDGFNDEDILDFEEYLTAFTGYREHRPVAANARHHQYWYRTCSSAARLKRNLSRMLEHLSLKGLIRQSGSDFVLRKHTVRGDGRG